MAVPVCFLGFGEAAQGFCSDSRWQGQGCGYDIKLTQPEYARDKISDFETLGVTPKPGLAALSETVDLVLSVVTADQAVTAARETAGHLNPGTLFLGMNSVAPATKREIADSLGARGIDYVDVAIMAPVNPGQLDVPLLISGEKAADARAKLASLGFQNTRIVGDRVGQACCIKMLRSVMIKGIEALAAECVTAADRADVTEEVFASMGERWLNRVNYYLGRMMVHGVRRAAEMEEVVKTLQSLGVEAIMSRGTVRRQLEIGSLGINPPPGNLSDKLAVLNTGLNTGLMEAAR
ncbi:MAG: NAD(P)-dependent oxidoreductase [Hyphomonadaceae bacterium]|nr:NAD(P)-dependent oxidoreductase [Hyphomonadaceae bacterium]